MLPFRLALATASLAATLALGSCSDPMLVTAPRSALWRVEWSELIEVPCTAGTDREVGSRHMLSGEATFRIDRPVDDTRAEIPAINASAKIPTVIFYLSSNCDAAAHETPVVVTKPTATTPWEIEGNVVEHPGIDTLHLTLRGRIDPAIARITMKDAARTVVEAPVFDGDAGFTVKVPYSYRQKRFDLLGFTPGDRVPTRVTIELEYIGG